ncbi:ABC transporter ATP-binding protein [Candidatus Nephthysia bennettiae]|uniref:ABC transporter ATP-binding protein n=1 Tax=Candidatus Nephthysia bennettiae TaxID=3127016 RepID=A0A934K4T3_9BACT|nr:ABC transporter ATP-binding protein [Candidatus Dormibacteraeota bacterium]MBJ7610710.1 ABC transporter ATP-binding protein [Candidatus Dormibacteraeota bacterium]
MPEVRLEGVRFAYPRGLDVYPEPGLTLALSGGAIALVGENGAGKTTLTKLLNGLLRPRAGSVSVAGTAVAGISVARMARVVGYAFQNPDDQLFERTVRAEVSFGPRALGRADAELEPAVARALALCGLEGKEDVHPHDLGLAERKWVAIASALAAEPPVVVLDEPTLGQDQRSRWRLRGLLEALAGQGRLVLVVTHDMDFVAESCPTIVVLSHGVVRHAGPTEAAFADQAVIEEAGLEPPHVAQLARTLGLGTQVTEAAFLSAWMKQVPPPCGEG